MRECCKFEGARKNVELVTIRNEFVLQGKQLGAFLIAECRLETRMEYVESAGIGVVPGEVRPAA